MARGDWDWQAKSRSAEATANLHVCQALLRIYRTVEFRLDEIDCSRAARPFWPLFRLHPAEFRAAASQLRSRRARRRSRDSDLADFEVELAAEPGAGDTLSVEPPDDLEAFGVAMLSGSGSFSPLLQAVEETIARLLQRRVLPCDKQISCLADLLKLSGPEIAFLRLAGAAHVSTIGAGPFACVNGVNRLQRGIHAAIGGSQELRGRSLLQSRSALMRSGLLEAESGTLIGDMEDALRLSPQGTLLFESRVKTLAEMADLVLRKLPSRQEQELKWPHIADRTELLKSLLANALRTRTAGVNVLIYGAAGTGKTCYVQQLVQDVGALGFAVTDRDASGDAPTRNERLSNLLLTQLFAPTGRSVIVLDEAEDVFQSDYGDPLVRALAGQKESKSWTNSLLEDNAHPVIWISNRIEHLDPAYLRRFTCCLELPLTPRGIRATIAQRHLLPLGCSPETVNLVANCSDASPALVAAAARFASVAGLRKEKVDAGVQAVLRDTLHAMGHELRAGLPQRSTRYDTRYLNVQSALAPARILSALERVGRGRVILGGPPGTGKSQLAAEIALRLGRELVVQTAADVNTMWFGESERNVARMFRECDPASDVLFLDEAEVLLASRDGSQHRAHQAVTAEFLRQLEAFEGVFVCATNYQDSLDAALMRRFEFRLELLPLTTAQRTELLCEMGLGWIPDSGAACPVLQEAQGARLERLTELTPGDFANAGRRLAALGEALDPETLLAELEAEHAAKPSARKRGPGFV